MKAKNFRKRRLSETEDPDSDSDHEKSALALEEVKFLQKQRETKSGFSALPTPLSSTTGAGTAAIKLSDKNEGDGEKDELVLQDTFAQETAVLEEDPNMLRYVEQELAKKRGKNIDSEKVENEVNRAEDELYKIPEHLKVKKRSSEESSTQWTTGIAEIHLPIEYKLKNIEETEAAKKMLQEKRIVSRAKTESSIPSSFSADFFQRGKEYTERVRKDKSSNDNVSESRDGDLVPDGAIRRQAATDQIMLERFRKRERNRGGRR